ncbi:molybdopterin-synthase adenylyltransferase MoeB [Salinarchaeum chitinilyticum]
MSELDLGPEQLERYARHVVMDDVGPEGQAALLDASILVVGAGGLGCPAIQYLAAAGIGRLGIVDDDVVERSNLQRQVLHGEADLDRPKVESAAESVAALNPDVTVEPHETRLTAENAPELIADYDVVLDASDNFPTRFLVNDACVLAETPFAHGAVFQFEGQLTTIAAGGRPCYRCLFPEAPPAGTVPNCATAGVLGVLPGTIGAMQATEAIKLLLDVGEPLTEAVVYYDARNPGTETVELRRRPDCPVCGEDATIQAVGDVTYEGGCTVDAD